MNDKINFYLHRSNQFPTLPTIYTNLMQVMSSPRASIQDLAEVIMKDQVSVVKLLKVVNSSLYSLQGRISTVNQAIFYLGFNEVKNLLLALSVMDIFNKINNADKFNVVDLWKHSLAVGVISKLLAARLNIKDTENFFISGIIHDIGKLFFIHFMSDLYFEVVEKSNFENRPLNQVEFEIFGTTHEMIGAELAKKWNLPQQLCDTIQYHEKGKIGNKTELILAVVHLSNITASLMKLGYSGDIHIQQPTFEIWNVINLPSGTLKDLYDPIMLAYHTANNILSIK